MKRCPACQQELFPSETVCPKCLFGKPAPDDEYHIPPAIVAQAILMGLFLLQTAGLLFLVALFVSFLVTVLVAPSFERGPNSFILISLGVATVTAVCVLGMGCWVIRRFVRYTRGFVRASEEAARAAQMPQE